MPHRKRKCLCCHDYGIAEDGIKTIVGWFISPAHILAYSKRKQEKDRAKQDRAERQSFKQDTKQRKEKLKTRRDWMKDAQKAFNAYIRKRDEWEMCACCGEWEDDSGMTGGTWDCGHWLSVGAHPQHRFDEANAHKQLKACNAGSGKYTKKGYTVQQQYRERLIIKIGLAEVERLETDHEPKKYTIDDLKLIKATFKQKLKDLPALPEQEQA